MIATPILGMAVTLAAGSAPAAADELAIRSITVKPGTPVVGPTGAVKVVIEVMARGATAVSVLLEPGRTGPVTPSGPRTPPSPGVQPPANPGTPGNVVPGVPAQPPAHGQFPAQAPAQAPAQPAAQAPAQPPAQFPAQAPAPAQASSQVPAQVKAPVPAQPQVQAQVPSQVPGQVKAPVAAQVPAKVPAPVPAQAPAKIPAPLPAQTSGHVPAQVKAPMPTQAPTAKVPAPTQALGAPAAAPAAGAPAAANAHTIPHGPMRAMSASVPGAGNDRSEWETWLFLPEKPLSRWYPSGQWTVTATARNAQGNVVNYRTIFFLKRQTTLEGVNVLRSVNNQVRITGTLLRVDPLGRVDYRPFAGQSVSLAFRPAGSGVWRTMGTAVTDKNGWFSSRLRGMGDGVWRAEYAGTGHYAGDISLDKHP
ncbi:hypothetical protein GCM10023193_66020 [Planotetraspora kaengkrachanensis]